jgi:broad specificity phosphatase PhoE
VAQDPLTLYFTRHGESVANQSDRAGVPRPPESDRLSPLGWEQARGVGERLRDTGVELIVASDMRRAQETAQGIGEVLGIGSVETLGALREVRQSDAFYAASPAFGDTATLNWMPTAEPGYAPPGAESFDAIVARVHEVQRALAERAAGQRIVAVSHHNFLHYFLGVTLFGEAFGPAHVVPLFNASHANTGISIFGHGPRRMDGLDFSGWSLTTWNDQAHL